MRLALSVLTTAALFSVEGCSKKVRSQSGGYISPAVSDSLDAHAISNLPTRPDGGAVAGKAGPIDLEAVEASRNANLIQPLVFGQSVGGIKMTTPFSEARSILHYIGSNDEGVEFYSEHLAIIWGAGDDPRPGLLYVQEGYGSPLELPAPYGKLAPGQSLISFMATEADRKSFLLGVGAAIEKQTGGYDCETSLTCQFSEQNGLFIFQYKRGALLINNFAPYKLENIVFTPTQTFFPRAKDPILYNLSIAGATFSTKRATFEAKYGPSSGPNGGFEFYDRNSVAIEWGVNNTPLTMAANNTYQGTMNFGATIGARKIGDSFAAFAAPATDATGVELMKAVIRGVLNKPAAFDCTAAATPATEACRIDASVEGLFIISVDRSSFIFTSDASRLFLQYQVEAP